MIQFVLVKNSKMLRRRASKSTTESFTLGPPLRLTDIDSQSLTKQVQSQEENKENSMNNHDNIEPEVEPVGCIKNEAVMHSVMPEIPSVKPPHFALTHPCNTPVCCSEQKPVPSERVNSGYFVDPESALLIGSKKLRKLSVFGRGGSSKVSLKGIMTCVSEHLNLQVKH